MFSLSLNMVSHCFEWHWPSLFNSPQPRVKVTIRILISQGGVPWTPYRMQWVSLQASLLPFRSLCYSLSRIQGPPQQGSCGSSPLLPWSGTGLIHGGTWRMNVPHSYKSIMDQYVDFTWIFKNPTMPLLVSLRPEPHALCRYLFPFSSASSTLGNSLLCLKEHLGDILWVLWDQS